MKKETVIEEIIAPEAPRNIVAVIFGTLALFALMNIPAALYFRTHPESKANYQSWKWGLLFDLKKPLDWMILGDSSALYSLDPRVFQNAFGGDALSLATTGGAGLPDVAWMMEEHIRRLGPPKNVVFLNDATVWTQEFIVESVLIPLPFHRLLALKPRPKISWKNMDRYMLIRTVPLFTLHQFTENVQSGPSSDRDEFFLGFHSRTKTSPFTVQTMSTSEISHFRDEPFTLPSMNAEAMDAIVDMANRYNIEVYIVNQPRHDYLFQNPDFNVFYERTQKVFEGFEARSPHIHYLRTPRALPADRFFDNIHVLANGAAEYSAQVVEQIKNHAH